MISDTQAAKQPVQTTGVRSLYVHRDTQELHPSSKHMSLTWERRTSGDDSFGARPRLR